MGNAKDRDMNVAAASFDELMAKDSPYWDKKHPKHAAAKIRVASHHEAQAKARAAQETQARQAIRNVGQTR